jgi:hypothetical protein
MLFSMGKLALLALCFDAQSYCVRHAAARENMAMRVRIAEWLGQPLGYQASLGLEVVR